MHGDNELTRKERGILDFFMAMIGLRSRKRLGWWSMIKPMADYSRGHLGKTPSHALFGCGSSLRHCKAKLDGLYIESLPALMDSIFGESTIFMAFDNWQEGIPRTWQTGGHSWLYHVS